MCGTYAISTETHLQHTSRKIETLQTETCSIRVQPLQHMQHPDILLQHQHETLTTYL
jgi:hypothetical protein